MVDQGSALKVDVAVILAAGGSTRMGRSKALLPWGERPLVDAHRLALRAVADRVVVVAGADEAELRRALPPEVVVAGARDWATTGPSDSARLGLAAAPGARSALVTPVDVVPAPLAWLVPLVATRGAAVPVGSDGREGHPVRLDAPALEAVRSGRSLPAGLRELLGGAERVPLPSALVGEDFDEPADYERVRAEALGPARWQVLVEEGDGPNAWTWTPGLPERELLAWFRGVDPRDGVRDRLRALDLVGTVRPVPASRRAAFDRARQGGTRWTARISAVDDSWLRAPDGREARPWLSHEVQLEALVARRREVEEAWDAVLGLESCEEVAAALVACPFPFEVWHEVDLSWHRLGPGLGATLGAAPALRAVDRIDLSGNGLDDAGVRALVESPHFRARHLTFSDGLDPAAVARLARAPTVIRIDLGSQGVVHAR